MMPAEDIAAIRGLLEEALRPFSGLPQTVKDLGTEVVRLRDVVERLEPRSNDLAGDVRGLERTLAKVAPLLQRFGDIADHTMPEFVSKLESLAGNHESMQGQIERIERESQRAAGAGER